VKAAGATALYRSTIGKKLIMAVTGLIMLAFVVVHMLGNLKIFFGATDFNHYAEWLRTIGEPIVRNGWYLWVQRFVLLIALIAHIWAAVSLSKQDIQARPVRYQGGRKGGHATWYMRSGGIVLAAFIVYHLLDMTTGTLNQAPDGAGVYARVVYDFNTWYVTLAYTVAMIALCFHIGHGLWSAANTLGLKPSTQKAFRTGSAVFAVVLAIGFLAVPFAVVFGIVNINGV
jgi:succinate dehydrogenase / fumarate reductase, cytochrome b subunit